MSTGEAELFPFPPTSKADPEAVEYQDNVYELDDWREPALIEQSVEDPVPEKPKNDLLRKYAVLGAVAIPGWVLVIKAATINNAQVMGVGGGLVLAGYLYRPFLELREEWRQEKSAKPSVKRSSDKS